MRTKVREKPRVIKEPCPKCGKSKIVSDDLQWCINMMCNWNLAYVYINS